MKKNVPQTKPWSIRVLNFFIFLGVLLFVAAFGGWYWLKSEMDSPRPHDAANKTITVEPGASSSTILDRLNREGVLESEFATRLYLRVFARNQKFRAGDYKFKSPITAREVIAKLVRGEVATREFTIPEGYNQYDIARVLAGLQGLKDPPVSQPESVLRLFKDTSLIADIDPQATSLEGYLFPDTYEYGASTTRKQLVEAMVKRFRRVYTAEAQQRASQMGMTARQVIALASLVEKEARVDSERELISSVFHRRLKLRVPLGCDPTVVYAALLANKYRGKIYQSDLDRDSPYNTYKYPGLPPGPIA
ncbi:MAG TPA: endolytic transglycosylase MltG, partial [Blastocatellia bacterium]|nr:endolytic transglycosylase MltG [Blastocatellia bacterium]